MKIAVILSVFIFFCCEANDREVFEQISIAIRDSDLDKVYQLIPRMTNINEKNKNHDTLMHVSINRGNIEALKAFIDNGADIDVADYFGRSLLITALIKNANDIALFLIREGADCTKVDDSGANPLFYATSLNIVRELIKNGADINTVNVLGSTPLHIYYLSGFLEGVRYLLQLGADPTVNNYKGISVYDLAKQEGYELGKMP